MVAWFQGWPHFKSPGKSYTLHYRELPPWEGVYSSLLFQGPGGGLKWGHPWQWCGWTKHIWPPEMRPHYSELPLICPPDLWNEATKHITVNEVPLHSCTSYKSNYHSQGYHVNLDLLWYEKIIRATSRAVTRLPWQQHTEMLYQYTPLWFTSPHTGHLHYYPLG